MSARVLAFSLLILTAATLTFFSGSTGEARNTNLKTIFRRPLIIGASVSSGYATLGPGTRAALRFTSKSNIRNIARNGMRGAAYRNLNTSFLKNYSVIIAVDFLFWDSVRSDFKESVRALDHLLNSAASLGIPVVIGDIPELIPFQFNRSRLNREIRARCKTKNRCYVLPLVELHRQAEEEGIMIRGKRYEYRDLTTDGLHLNSMGSEYLAEKIIELLSRG